MDAMIDTETLSVYPNAVILTLAAVKFNPRHTAGITDKIYLRLDVDEQLSLDRHVDSGTVEWWSKQSSTVIDEAMSDNDRVPIRVALTELTKFLVGVDNIWAQGILFDIGILENIFNQVGMHCPWQYWQILDSRTLFKSLNYDPRQSLRDSNNLSHHNALSDATSQALSVQKCFKLIREFNTDALR